MAVVVQWFHLLLEPVGGAGDGRSCEPITEPEIQAESSLRPNYGVKNKFEGHRSTSKLDRS